MRRIAFALAASFGLLLATYSSAGAAGPTINPPPSPPAGPIPIPYPNLNIPAAHNSRALRGFGIAKVATGGIVDDGVSTDEIVY